MTSYENGIFKTDGLLEKLVAQLSEKHIREKIILVSQYQPDLDKAKELGIKNQAADEFFPKVPVTSLTSATLLNNLAMTSATTAPTPISFHPNNLLQVSRPLFVNVPQPEENPSTENTPLLGHGK